MISSSSTWKIQVLGRVSAQCDSKSITRFRTERTGVLLAYLAYYPSRAHPREQLIELLWPDRSPDSGRNCLSIELSSLRHQFEPPGTPRGAVIRADNLYVQINPLAISTDVAEFETALGLASTAGSRAIQVKALSEAVALYTGPLLTGCWLPGCYENWIKPEQDRLNEAYLQALRRLIRHEIEEKEYYHALDYARKAVNLDPLREESHQELIWLYAAVGEFSTALQQYRDLEQLLLRELNLRPSQQTRDLVKKIEERLEKEGFKPPSPTDPPPPPPAPRIPQLPSGTLTFLLTTLEKSDGATLPQEDEQGKAPDIQALLHRIASGLHGHEVPFDEAGLLFVFSSAVDAVECARQLLEATSLPPRVALHTGEARPNGATYVSPAVDQVYRLIGAAQSGQILCTEATVNVLPSELDAGIRLVDLGRHQLPDAPAETRLFQLELPGRTNPVFVPPNTQSADMSRLPMRLTRFFGRDRERTRLVHLLLAERRRLVTVTGQGGIGKTRIALETAADLTDPLQGAVWFVPLDALSEAQSIPDAIHAALRLRRSTAVPLLDQIVEQLQRRPSLLVLDNFEHLVEEGSLLVRTLLERIPSLQCLVTSRQRLSLVGELEYPLAPLPTPKPSFPPEQQVEFASVRLFVDRAQSVKPDFQVTKANAAVVATLCGRLEGIPLAIELAASRVQMQTVGEILAQLEHRLDFLADKRRDAVERHRSLRAVMDWGYRLMAPELQQFFARLCLFRGGWTVEAAEAVCMKPGGGATADTEGGGEASLVAEPQSQYSTLEQGAGAPGSVEAPSQRPTPDTRRPNEALDFLAQLRECSQILVEEFEDEMRFSLLDTVREYAAEQLTPEELAETAERHADYYLHLAEQADPHLSDAEAPIWLDRLEQEHENLRSALQWSLEAKGKREEGKGKRVRIDPLPSELGLRLACALWQFWYIRGYHLQGLEWLKRLLALEGDPTPVRIRALNSAGNLAYDIGDYDTARDFYERALTLSEKIGNESWIAVASSNLGLIASDQKEFLRATELFEKSLSLNRKLEIRKGVAVQLVNLADLSRKQKEYIQACKLYQESLAIYRALDLSHHLVIGLNNLADNLIEMQEYEQIPALVEESLTLSLALESGPAVAHCLMVAFTLAARIREMERAAVLHGAVMGLHERLNLPIPSRISEDMGQDLDAARIVLGDQALDAARQRGHEMALDQAAGYMQEWIAERKTAPPTPATKN